MKTALNAHKYLHTVVNNCNKTKYRQQPFNSEHYANATALKLLPNYQDLVDHISPLIL